MDEREDLKLEEKHHKKFPDMKKGIFNFAKEFVLQMYESFTRVYRDSVIFKDMILKKGWDENKYDLEEICLRRHLMTDLVVKFIPYSILVALPFTPFLLAMYLPLFPHSIPSEFLPDEIAEKRRLAWYQRQESAAKILNDALRTYDHGNNDHHVFTNLNLWQDGWTDEQKAQVSEYYVNRVITHGSEFEARHKFVGMSPQKLELLAQFFIEEYIPSTRWAGYLTRLYLLPTYIWYIGKRLGGNKQAFKEREEMVKANLPKYNTGSSKYFKTWLLAKQLKSHFKHIRMQDRVLSRDMSQLDKLDADHLQEFARERGILLSNPESIKEYIKKQWVPLSVRPDITDEQLIWIAVLRVDTARYYYKEQ